MNKLNFLSLLLSAILFFSCGKTESKKEKIIDEKEVGDVFIPNYEKDLDAILKEGKLVVTTTYSATSYFLYRGETMGFNFELLDRFAKHLGVELEIVVARNIDSMIPNLNDGSVDLIAHELTITKHRKKYVDFSSPLFLTKQVLVQKKPENWRKMKLHQIDKFLIQDVIELENVKVSVREKTSYAERLKNLSKEIGGRILIDTLDGNLTNDDIITKVVDGEIKYTVLDDFIARIYASSYPVLDVEVPVSFSQKIAWATRKNSPVLLEALNDWLDDFKGDVDYHVIYNKYFKNNRSFNKRIESGFLSVNSNRISRYDDMMVKYSNDIGWDWRLVASLVYQESRFDPKASSWAGAGGLMQIMPATAKELDVKNVDSPQGSVEGGTKYLKQLYDRFDDVEAHEEKIKFAMASYNCGYGHVLDAQALARKRGLNPSIWHGNVAETLLSLSASKNYNDPVVKYGYTRGIEPYMYVREIFKRYEHYKEFIEI